MKTKTPKEQNRRNNKQMKKTSASPSFPHLQHIFIHPGGGESMACHTVEHFVLSALLLMFNVVSHWLGSRPLVSDTPSSVGSSQNSSQTFLCPPESWRSCGCPSTGKSLPELQQVLDGMDVRVGHPAQAGAGHPKANLSPHQLSCLKDILRPAWHPVAAGRLVLLW